MHARTRYDMKLSLGLLTILLLVFGDGYSFGYSFLGLRFSVDMHFERNCGF
jgi:hypothetical protein